MASKGYCVQTFEEHEAGASCLAFASQKQLLVTAGKKGVVCVWDLRAARIRNKFKVHEQAIKCMAMDATETMVVMGSADGDIKIWDLEGRQSIHSFPGEHAKH